MLCENNEDKLQYIMVTDIHTDIAGLILKNFNVLNSYYLLWEFCIPRDCKFMCCFLINEKEEEYAQEQQKIIFQDISNIATHRRHNLSLNYIRDRFQSELEKICEEKLEFKCARKMIGLTEKQLLGWQLRDGCKEKTNTRRGEQDKLLRFYLE